MAVPAEYGTPTRVLDWAGVSARLLAARHYWLATTRPDGRPHVVPHDGLWIDDRWFFGGNPRTVKHANLLANPHAALHLEDGAAAVIVEGRCRIEVPTEAEAEGLVDTSRAKYGFAPPVAAYLQGVWVLTPVKALAWNDLTTDATRFDFTA